MKIYIIGAGPGAPDLITVRGLKLLQEADVVMYADSLVSEELIAQAKSGSEVLKTAGMHLEEMVEIMENRVREGKKSYVFIQVILLSMARSWSRWFF